MTAAPAASPKTAAESAAEAFAERLDRKLMGHLRLIEQSRLYRVMMDPKTTLETTREIMKRVLLEVFSYGPHVTEATFTAIGRFPKDRPDLMKPLILHDIEEADHGEMALKDFVKLGGDEAWARARRITPASFAMGATCRMIGDRENPFAYLGYMYLFEALTPILTERAQKILASKMYPKEAQYFVDFHAEEDIAHARSLRNLIVRIVGEYPDAADAIDYAFDCFAAVYPLPIWEACMEAVERDGQ